MYKKIKAENILIIGLALILVIIVVIIIYVNDRLHTQVRKAIRNQSKTFSPTPSSLSLTPTSYQDVGIVTYDQSADERIIEKIHNRTPLSPSDKEAKARILSLINNGATVYQSPTIRIEYNDAQDMFEVEIDTADTDLAKQEAVRWFLDQGASQDAICNYPVEFYVGYDAQTELRNQNQNISFSALPPNCQ